MNKTICGVGALLGMLAVILGAFGAHGLEKLIDPSSLQSFETGVRYQMYHALLLLVLGVMPQLGASDKKAIFYLVGAGTVLFSFSIYLLATNELTGFDFRSIGFVTPVGGTLLIVGWGLFGYRVYKRFN
ncbi:DUF423 domain-containing protein [Pseudozobellia thermophila]|uniref:Uncharacterized membrane protein YgdD, TMEM256/DUF423 family n=1 Tax=Pseudozobellia thermophila TaxID=192903 RepID=A0A1M6AHJ0_9FLAO|nr:DUF423 domain-containing protein [Pseudozobellia thermophila]SHI35912.1 Uncharacterized membrane protein YgdD, TMEM256/DUF423 family [Pseudozobellia thermophila]